MDPGDIEKNFDLWWQKYNTFEIEAAKEQVAVLLRLTPLYHRLVQGTEDDWEEYARLRLRASLDSQLMQALLKMTANTEQL